MGPSDEEVRRTAYRRWQERGCPEGSPEVDWYGAEEELRSLPSDPAPATKNAVSSGSKRPRSRTGSGTKS